MQGNIFATEESMTRPPTFSTKNNGNDIILIRRSTELKIGEAHNNNNINKHHR